MSQCGMALTFKRTFTPNLDRAVEYGTFYGRVKLKRKTIRECLGTTQRAAEGKLVAWLISKRGQKRVRSGTLNSLTEPWLTQLQGKLDTGDLDEETVKYKQECLRAIRNTWGDFSRVNISKLTRQKLEEFRVGHRKKYFGNANMRGSDRGKGDPGVVGGIGAPFRGGPRKSGKKIQIR